MSAERLGLCLDLGCGGKVRPGYLGVDRVELPGVLRFDLLDFPWPWPDASVDDVWCSHYFEHVPGRLRGRWMDELYRVLIPDGTATITVPTHDSPGAIQDFTHEWPPVCRESFFYFNREARRAMGLEHYPVSCNFQISGLREFFALIPQLEVRLTKLV